MYAPNLLINHNKSMRSTVKIAPASLDESMSGHPRGHGGHNMSQSVSSLNDMSLGGTAGKRSHSAMDVRRSGTPDMSKPSLGGSHAFGASRSATPSIFGNKTGTTGKVGSTVGKLGGTKKSDKKHETGSKVPQLPVEEVDVFVPSAKELKEAKELFRQFDTDGDGTLTMSEIQASLYFNNVDYEEIQAIFGPNGIKGLGPNGTVSVEEFAAFLCRRRRENANRQQSSHVAKHSKIARVYISSCVHQHHAERRVLHEQVLPRLAKMCQNLGGELVPVDLRYHSGACGSNLAGPSQSEAMGELSRVATDRNYYFLGLAGDFPGECVLPSEVSMSEFETLKASAKIFEAASDDKGLPQALENLYAMDKNAVIPTYVLRDGSEQDQTMVIKAFAEHEGEEQQLHSSFSKVRAKIAKSLNEQEVTKCLSLGSELDQARRTFLFLRSIDDMPFDKQKVLMPGKTDEELLQVADRQNIFKENIYDRLNGNNVFKYTVPYTSADIKINEATPYAQKAAMEVQHSGYLEKFASDAYMALAGPIAEMLSKPPVGALQMELDAHVNRMRRTSSPIFHAEADDIFRTINEYIHGSPARLDLQQKLQNANDVKSRKRAKDELEKLPIPNSPLIVIGSVGSGKTNILSYVAEKFSYSKEAGHSAVIYRSIGGTPLSSDGRLLLDGLCEELAKLSGSARNGPRPPSYNNLLVEFGELLRTMGNKKTVVLFLDGLDKLPHTDHALRLSWLPTVLPDNVYVVGTSVSVQEPPALQRYPKQNLPVLAPVVPVSYKPLVNFWLENYKQGLQEAQKEELVKQVAAMGTPAAGVRTHLRMCFDEATNGVASFVTPDRLTEISTKPGVMVFELLGLVLASKGGLTEHELHILLDIQEDCKRTGALPYLRFHRGLQRLQPYLQSQERDMRTVTVLRHESYRAIILSIDAFKERLKEWNTRLAKFFDEQPTKFTSEAGVVTINLRKLRYLVYYQLEAEMWGDVGRVLCSIENIQAMCEAGMSIELQRMFTSALRSIPQDFAPEGDVPGWKTVQSFYRFFLRTVQALANHSRMIEQPGIVVQMGANEPLNTEPERQAQDILKADGDSRVWMHALNKAGSVSPLYATLLGSHTTIRASHISFDGALIATGSDGGAVQIWDAETGESVTALEGHTAAVNDVKFMASGHLLVSCSTDGTAKVWDESNATCIMTYKGHNDAPLLGLAVQRGGDELIATCCQDGTVHIWKNDGANGQKTQELKGHANAVKACCFSGDGQRIATASLDKTVRVYEIANGKCLYEFEHIGKVYDVHFSSDSTKLLSASAFATCTLWNLEGALPNAADNKPLREYKTGSGTCFSCCFLNGDKCIAMSSEHGSVYFWDAEKDSDKSLLDIQAHDEIIYRTSVSLDGNWLVTSGADKLTRVWNANTVKDNIQRQLEMEVSAGKLEAEEEEGLEREHAMLDEGEEATEAEPDEGDVRDIVRCISISCGAEWGAACSEHGSLNVWDLSKAEVVLRCRVPSVVRVVRFHPNQPGMLLAACDDGFVRAFDVVEALASHETAVAGGSGGPKVAAATPVNEFGYHELCIRSLRFSRDGSKFITGSIDATARVWSMESISHELCLEGHRDTVLDAEIAGNMALVATASTDKTVRVWGMKGGKEQWVGKHGAYVYAVTFSSDCKRVVSSSGDRTARVWASKKGECLHILKASSALLTCSLSDTANLVLCSGYEGSLHIWDTKAYEAPPIDCHGHGAEIRCSEFSKYGGFAVTASNDGSVRVFDTRNGASLGALPLRYPVYSMAAFIDETRALCMCGDEQGNVTVVQINGVRDILDIGSDGAASPNVTTNTSLDATGSRAAIPPYAKPGDHH